MDRIRITGQSTADARTQLESQDQLLSHLRNSIHNIQTVFMVCTEAFYHNYIHFKPYTEMAKPGMPKLFVPDSITRECPCCGGGQPYCTLCAVMGVMLGLFCGGTGVQFTSPISSACALSLGQDIKFDLSEVQSRFIDLVFGTYRGKSFVRNNPMIPLAAAPPVTSAFMRQLPTAYAAIGIPIDPTNLRQIEMEQRDLANMVTTAKTMLPTLQTQRDMRAMIQATRAAAMKKVHYKAQLQLMSARLEANPGNAVGRRKTAPFRTGDGNADAIHHPRKGTPEFKIQTVESGSSSSTVSMSQQPAVMSVTSSQQAVAVETDALPKPAKRPNTEPIRASANEATLEEVLKYVVIKGNAKTGTCVKERVGKALADDTNLKMEGHVYNAAVVQWRNGLVASLIREPTFAEASRPAAASSSAIDDVAPLEKLQRASDELKSASGKHLSHFFKFCHALSEYRSKSPDKTDADVAKIVEKNRYAPKRIRSLNTIGECIELAPRMELLCSSAYSVSFFELNAGQLLRELKVFSEGAGMLFRRIWVSGENPPIRTASSAAAAASPKVASPYPPSLQTATSAPSPSNAIRS